MNPSDLASLLSSVQSGATSIEKALEELEGFPGQTLGSACIDHQRQLRTGIPEVIYGASKSGEQIIEIAASMYARKGVVLATRVSPEKAKVVTEALPQLRYDTSSRLLIGNTRPPTHEKYRGKSLVICAGTSDIGVAEEARLTLKTFGHPVEKLYDVGVAGLHRLLNRRELLTSATVIIVVAGMEGALPSVVGGLVSCPVIAVPTSVGYGASFNGIAALLGMLNSCAPGLAVVNIDNGFGAACMAEAINKKS